MTLSLQNHRLRHNRRAYRFFIGFALIAFLTIKAFVPPGFMPSDGSTNAFYMLCHGDAGAAQLIMLNNTASQMDSLHAGHTMAASGTSHTSHDSHHLAASHLAEQSFCIYASLLSLVVAISFIVLGLFLFTRAAATYTPFIYFHKLPSFILPAVRAPPTSFFSA